MRRTDLLIVCPAKFGGWMMKNPTIVEIGHKQNGVTEMRMRNSVGWTVDFYTKDPDDALEYIAGFIATENGCVSLETAMRDLIVPRSAYFGNEDEGDE